MKLIRIGRSIGGKRNYVGTKKYVHPVQFYNL